MNFGSHVGDFDAATVIHGKFTSCLNGSYEAFALSGGTLVVYGPGNGTTEVTGGTIVLTPDFDSVAGLNHYSVDTTGYAAGFYQVVLSAGTVDGAARAGNVIGSFTIRKTAALKPTAAGRTLNVDAVGSADADLMRILHTAISEPVVGVVGGAFEQFFNVAAPTATMDHGIQVDTVNGLSASAANAIADALLDRTSAIDGKTVRQALRIIGATTAGKISGAQTSTEIFVGLDGSTTRVTVTADSSGNRSAVVYA